MPTNSGTASAVQDALSKELLEELGKLFGSHPGFRPVHAKGVMCTGVFVPSAEATSLTRAPHVQGGELPVVVRFSNSTGIPNIPDSDPNASPRGFAVRFYMGEHLHTDIIGHSENGFPTRTGEEFLELAKALVGSGADAPKPTPLEIFMSTHPRAKHFFEAPKPNPTSFARESYFGVTAFKFTNAAGVSRFGRFKIVPPEGTEFLSAEEISGKGVNFLFDEISERVARTTVTLRIQVQLAKDGDQIADATIPWPDDRQLVEFGTLNLTERAHDDDLEKKKIIFDPIPRVDGIDPSADPLLELRAALYLMSGRKRRHESAQ